MNKTELLQNDLAVQKEKIISKSEYWISFIQTMSRHYKHNSDIQLFIHSQFPNATACADADLWKRKFNRTVLIGEKCVHFFTNDNKPTYLYDISQTAPIPGKPQKMPWIWSLFDNKLKISYTENVKDGLIRKHSLSSENLPDCLSELCFRKTAEYLKDDQSDFFKLIYESVSYCVKYRCCPNEAVPCTEKFSSLNQYSADKLISTVSHTVNEVFADIEALTLSEKRRIIENIRSNNYELGNKNNQRNTSREMPRNERISTGYDSRKRNNMDTAREQVSILPSGVQGTETGGDNSADEGRNHRGGSSGGINAQIRSDVRRTGASSTGGTGELLSNRGKPLGRDGGRDSSREIRHSLQELSSELQTGAIRGNDEQRLFKQTSSERKQPNSGVDGNNNRAAARRKHGISDGSGNRRLPDNDAADEQLYKVGRGNSAGTNHAVKQSLEQLSLFDNTDSEQIHVTPVNQIQKNEEKAVYLNIELAGMEYDSDTEKKLSALKAEAFANIPDDKSVHNETVSAEIDTSKDNTNLNEIFVDFPEKVTVPKTQEPKSGAPVTYHIESDNIDQGGAKSRFKANIEAVKTLRIIESENRYASPEEQKILSAYTGWGGLTPAFDENNEKWQSEYALLKNTLSESEYTAARSSVLDSFYTPPIVIDSIYTALSHFGFSSGNILEPAAGIGNFLGKMPESMTEKSRIYATEIDNISGRIAQLLYPGADVQIKGFEHSAYPDGFFDAAIGNIPFGSFKIPDSRYDKYNFSVHDYFFAKTLDKVRPGGLIAFITSTGTLDKSNHAVRKYLAQRAELLGAVRLPNNTFKSYSGTEVTSDIIFLQKREKMADIVPDWVDIGSNADNLPINKYFADHPEMILGKLVQGNKLYGSGTMVVPYENFNLKESLTNAVLRINGRYVEKKAVIAGDTNSKSQKDFKPEILPADPQVKNFTYTLIDNKVFYREDSVMTQIPFKGTRFQRIKGLIETTKCVRSVIDMQVSGASDDSILKKQAELNSVYDSFTQKYGLIHSAENKRVFKEDISSPLLLSLEYVKDGKLERKADIFSKRTIYPHYKITHVDTASEALAVSISEKACIDLNFMAQLLGGSDKIPQIISDLKGVIYRNPEKSLDEFSGWETADEYLSGNIRSKIAAAEKAAASDPFYKDNITALNNALPTWLNAGEISVKLGSSWIDPEYIRQFIYETLSTPGCYRVRPFANNCIDVQHSPQFARWNITNKSLDKHNTKAAVTYGTSRCSAYELIEDCLNLRDTSVYDWSYVDGKKTSKLNRQETLLARQKQETLNLEFQNWIFKDPERRERLVKKYNYLYNSIRPREYDGSHLNFVGMNPLIKLKDHQKNAIARSLYGGNTLFAHTVGAGKTYEMIASAMEGKRLGLHHKSLIAVPNHMTEQFANDFLFLYPNANILVAGENDFKKENRKKLLAKISTGDIDAVILGHSQLIKIPVSPDTESKFIKAQIEELTENIKILKHQNGEHFSIREMEKVKKNMQARLEILLHSTVKDDVVTFEQLGVDKMFIDEADMFKNLGISTKMRNISGISANLDVQKTQDLYMKCQYLDELTGGKGICFATGTPVSNSISEIFIMQKYLQADLLKKKNLIHFDAWAADFAEKVTKLEYAPEGYTLFRR